MKQFEGKGETTPTNGFTSVSKEQCDSGAANRNGSLKAFERGTRQARAVCKEHTIRLGHVYTRHGALSKDGWGVRVPYTEIALGPHAEKKSAGKKPFRSLQRNGGGRRKGP